MISLPVTALYAGLMGLWLLGLGFEVMRRRRRHDVSVGDGGVRALELAMRAHGNACEYVPIALILLALAEGMGAPGGVLHLFGLMLVAGRLIHGGYFLAGARRLNLRILGMLLTVGMIGMVALGLVFHALARIG
ncbi:MAG: MAPEG family protein [Paracoccaceae bacterium]